MSEKRITSLQLATFALVGCLATGSAAFALDPHGIECEANRVQAEQAAAAAVTAHHELNVAVNGAVVGGSCAALLLLFAGADIGMTAAVCAIMTAGAVVATSPPANAAEIAGRAWSQIRDPRCFAK